MIEQIDDSAIRAHISQINNAMQSCLLDVRKALAYAEYLRLSNPEGEDSGHFIPSIPTRF